MIPQELYVVKLLNFLILLMTWNKLRHEQIFLSVIIMIPYVYPKTEYCRSALFRLFLPINPARVGLVRGLIGWWGRGGGPLDSPPLFTISLFFVQL